MGYKIKYALKKSKEVFIISIVLWIIISIGLIMPVTKGIIDAKNEENKFDINVFITSFGENYANIFETIKSTFGKEYRMTLLKGEGYLAIAIFLFTIIGMIKMMPENEYRDIEHGSSDWAENGEQYKILSRNKGILLAEKNYLPVDKRGNVNVLVVGRFRFW
ncbi:MAG: hypothetical protein ACI4VE_06300 [Clostridia bacterium]